MLGGVAIFVALLQIDVVQEKQGNANNFIQSLTWMYHHTSTASLNRLRGARTSWTPTLAGVSYQFGIIHFSICL